MEQQNNTMIRIEALTKTYAVPGGTVDALKGIDLEIRQGEIFGIIGMSGAGKSTLIRCMNLLERPTSGTIQIDGQDVTGLSKKALRQMRHSVGMIFQQFNLLMQTTVEKNIAFPLEITGVDKAQCAKRVKELLEIVGLSDKADAYPAQLSGGKSSAWPLPGAGGQPKGIAVRRGNQRTGSDDDGFHFGAAKAHQSADGDHDCCHHA